MGLELDWLDMSLLTVCIVGRTAVMSFLVAPSGHSKPRVDTSGRLFPFLLAALYPHFVPHKEYRHELRSSHPASECSGSD